LLLLGLVSKIGKQHSYIFLLILPTRLTAHVHHALNKQQRSYFPNREKPVPPTVLSVAGCVLSMLSIFLNKFICVEYELEGTDDDYRNYDDDIPRFWCVGLGMVGHAYWAVSEDQKGWATSIRAATFFAALALFLPRWGSLC
jgi:hypothetical protein